MTTKTTTNMVTQKIALSTVKENLLSLISRLEETKETNLTESDFTSLKEEIQSASTLSALTTSSLILDHETTLFDGSLFFWWLVQQAYSEE